ncbi:MAG: GGDEF domain-containing protein [Pseudomonadota bacterium]
MKKLADTAYWIYAAGSAISLGIGISVLSRYDDVTSNALRPLLGSFNILHFLFLFMTLTLLHGLFFAMPLLQRARNQQIQLTDRAAELEVAVVTDPLTGLYNRRYFEDALKEYLVEFNRMEAPLALLTLDLDHFKSVNDSYGHDAGDEVLKQLANRLCGLTREHDIVARTGGEEFCIVAPFSTPEQIRPFAERICRMVAEMRVDLGHVILRPTISIGVASTVAGQKTEAKDMTKVSDQNLYRAKSEGRNRVCI